jgi:HK97 family phage portal protein
MEALGALPTNAGVRISEHVAMKFEIWWVCVRAIADTLATPPLILYERLPGGGKRHASELPQFGLMHDAPNGETTSQYFRQTLMAHVCNWGNCYAEIERNVKGDPIALHPLLPDRTRAARVLVKDKATGDVQPQRVVICQVPQGEGFQGGSEVVLPAENVFHVPGLGFNGVSGYPVVRMARQSLGHAIAIDEFGARFFGSGARLSGVVEYPGVLSADAKDRIRTSLEVQHRGLSQSHRLAILDEGMKWQQTSVPPDDAQFLQSSLASVSRICRWFRVPPHIAMDLSRGTFSNIEVQSIEFIRFAMLHWYVAWEQWLNKALLTPEQRKRYFFEFLVEGFLRGSLQERYTAYAVGRQWGWLCADDVRELENMNPLPNNAGKMYLVPMNMVPADQAANVGQPPEKPKPTGTSPDDIGGGGSPAEASLPAWSSPVAGDVEARAALEARESRMLALAGVVPPSRGSVATREDPKLDDALRDVNRSMARAAKKQRQLRSAELRNRHRKAMLLIFHKAAQEIVRQEVQALRSVIKRAKRKRRERADGSDGQDDTAMPMRLAEFDSGMEEFYAGFGETIRRAVQPVVATLAGVVQPVIYGDELGLADGAEPDGAGADELAGAFAAGFAERHAGSAMGQLRAVVKMAESDGDDAGDAVDTCLGQWLDGGGGKAVPWADKIAAVESVRALSSVSKASYAAAGVTTLVWMAGGESCDLCSALVGETCEIGSSFRDEGGTVDPGEDSDAAPLTVRSGGLPFPPLHGGNCDCTVSAA